MLSRSTPMHATHSQLPDEYFGDIERKKDNPPKSNVFTNGVCMVEHTAQCNYGQGLRNMNLGRLASGVRVRGPVTAK